jgi:hypothetical protein
MVGPGRGRELLHAIELAVAPESERARATLSQQGIERLPHRDQTPSRRVDQSGVHPISRGQESVLGEDLHSGHHRRVVSLELKTRQRLDQRDQRSDLLEP